MAIPAAIAATKTKTPGDSVARLSSAGPGQSPTSPQPTPNRAAPSTSGGSTCVLVGQKLCRANTGRGRRLASMKPGAAMASAAIITTARLGSQAPKISRKPRTLAGCTIPEISRPAPNTSPQNRGATIHMISASEQVTRDRNGHDCRRHKDDGGRDGAPGQPRYAANAMAGRAAAPEPRAEADQQSCRDNHGPARRQFGWRHPIADQARDDRQQNESRDESHAPAFIVAPDVQQA